jgi:hypothetical protein
MRHTYSSVDTTVILHTGHGGILPAGRYEIAEMDGTEGQLLLVGPNGELVQADPNDSNIVIEEN